MMPSSQSIRLIFAGGGTGGHLFPAVALADRIAELAGTDCKLVIEFVGTHRGIEYRMRDRIGYPLRLVNVRGLVRSFTLTNLLVPFLVVGSLWQARSILKEVRPDLVVGTGGYVSWPILRMASAMKIPTVLQEQNSCPGIVTRKLACRAERVYLGFEAARSHITATAPMMVTGNPVRSSVSAGSREEAMTRFGLDQARRTILILGGSQGARSINQAVLKGLRTGCLGDRYQLLWQTGTADFVALTEQVGEKSERHVALAFEQRMDLAYAAADLVIARAGAITLAEIEACGKASLLIPYPFAAGDHQRHNARAYASSGIAEIIDPDELEHTDLLGRAVALLASGRTEQMIERMRQRNAGRKPAVDIIAEDIIRLISRKQEATVVC
jgi:UDP-N-acetylglucosamine--N-acetylmuramyl-(pentapeptide) pyrophosphoryl-undecaprenol N-acetylglucosamine transferase